MIVSEHCMIPISKSPQEYQAYRISSDSSNKIAICLQQRFAIAFDPLRNVSIISQTHSIST